MYQIYAIINSRSLFMIGVIFMTTKRLPLVLPSNLKERLEKMSDETNLSQNQLAVMALYSLIANYHKSGSFIFADLLDVSHREGKRS